ncbi:protein phosphatase 2C domain-containing protein [Aurantivibrio infirmus]
MSSPIHSAATDKGLIRDNNEDCYLSLPDKGVWLIADGMGGHEAGEVASSIVVDTIKQNTEEGKALAESIHEAHQSILSAADDGIGAKGMGSTVVALQSNASDYEIAWVGDSRAYLWTSDDKGGVLEQLSTDHSYVQLLVQSGAIAEEEASSHPDKNVITQCLGSQDVSQIKVDTVKGQWSEKQWILLCSDGLTDEVSDELIAQALCDSQTPQEAVNKLIKHALSHGGRDNVTVQIIASPLRIFPPLEFLWDWLPSIFGDRKWDAALYSATAVCFSLLCYWILV